MVKIVAYVRPGDPYSVRLVEFLRRKQLSFKEVHVSDDDPDAYQEMVAATGEAEPPQLVIDGEHVGDYETVTSLDLRGQFDDLVES